VTAFEVLQARHGERLAAVIAGAQDGLITRANATGRALAAR
jgi:hypothetical protein